MSAPTLTTAALVAGYEPTLPIVNGIDLAVAPGDFVTIMGPNGAGKSTFVKAIAGTVPIHSGRVLLGDFDLTRTDLHQRVRHGLAFVPQTENIFAKMSIADNLELAAQVLGPSLRRPRVDAMYAMFPDLASRPRMPAGRLSGGQRQMLAIARTLVVEPSVLILDEPSAGLSPKMVADVFATLTRINAQGVSILLVEQNVRAALAVARTAVVLVEGRIRHHGPAAELRDSPRLYELFLGTRGEAAA
jgi:branched-chain amino acid transport system ATP-binding protein